MKKLDELYEVGYRDVYAANPNGGIPIKQEQQEYLRSVPVKTASGGVRLLHHFVDGFIAQLGGGLMANIFPHNEWVSIPLALAFVIFYYAGMEALTGQTLAKMLTGSVVVDEYGQRIDFQTALLRTIIRIIPFDGFSFLGKETRGWHDSWAKTYVMNKKELAIILERLNESDEQSRIINSFVTQ